MEINGMAHVILTVSDLEKSVRFYEPLLNHCGLRTVINTPQMLYCVGGRTAVGIQPADVRFRSDRFVQTRVGLHHLCLRARERRDVDEMHEVAKSLGATIVHPPEDGPWAPGYYSVLFEDRDGIRIEVNHVPGKGLLADKPS